MLNNSTLDMTVGKPWQQILRFAFPIFLSSLFQQLYHLADSLIVGNFLGDDALAAVSSSGNLIFLLTSFFIGCASGAGVLISKHFGAKHYENMRKAIHTDVAFGLISAVILSVAGAILAPYILKWMNTDPDVLPKSITYFRWYFILASGIILFNCFSGILQAVGNSVMPLVFLIIASVSNILLDLLFIGVFKMDVIGASIATGISQMVSALMCLTFLCKKGTIYQLKLKEIKIHPEMMKKILYYGIPSGIQNSVIGLANVIVQSQINTFGKIAMAGCGIYSKIEGFAFLPVNSFTLALATFTSQNLGAKEYERAKKGARFGIITSLILAEIIGVLTFIFVPYVAQLFTETEEVIAITTHQNREIALFYFLLAFSHCAAAIQRGSGRAVIPMVIMLSVWCVFRIIFVYVAMKINHDLTLLFAIYPITWGISSIIYLFIHIFSDWVHNFEKKEQSITIVE